MQEVTISIDESIFEKVEKQVEDKYKKWRKDLIPPAAVVVLFFIAYRVIARTRVESYEECSHIMTLQEGDTTTTYSFTGHSNITMQEMKKKLGSGVLLFYRELACKGER